jgi:hypothetical protein
VIDCRLVDLCERKIAEVVDEAFQISTFATSAQGFTVLRILAVCDVSAFDAVDGSSTGT